MRVHLAFEIKIWSDATAMLLVLDRELAAAQHLQTDSRNNNNAAAIEEKTT